MKKRMISLLTLLLLLGSLSMAVSADEIPDLTQKGSITFTMDWEGKPLHGGSLSIYKVADITADEADWRFELIDILQGSKLSLDKVDDPKLAKSLAELAVKYQLKESKAKIIQGKAKFANVVPGLYVVMQNAGDVTKGYSPIDPFLISVPRYENGAYVLNVVADPKVPLETIPPETTKPTPTKPKDPDLPQTGQLNWPVPVLAVSGVGLFALGWILFSGRKKDDYEK